MKPIDLITIALGILCLLAIKFIPDQATTLVGIGMLLIGKALPQGLGRPSDAPKQSGHATPTIMFGMAFGLLACFVAFTVIPSCKTTPTSPDSFYQAVVTCTESNTANPQAEQAVYKCLVGAVQGDYAACLSGLVAGGTWTVDEVACLVRQYATTASVRLNSGTAKAVDDVGLSNANAWLRAEQIKYRRAAP
jgi:hypothetical protein